METRYPRWEHNVLAHAAWVVRGRTSRPLDLRGPRRDLATREVRFWRRVLSSAEVARVEAFARVRYGL